jgi:hypothetical protein
MDLFWRLEEMSATARKEAVKRTIDIDHARRSGLIWAIERRLKPRFGCKKQRANLHHEDAPSAEKFAAEHRRLTKNVGPFLTSDACVATSKRERFAREKNLSREPMHARSKRWDFSTIRQRVTRVHATSRAEKENAAGDFESAGGISMRTKTSTCVRTAA